jgi:hypothetical protein
MVFQVHVLLPLRSALLPSFSNMNIYLHSRLAILSCEDRSEEAVGLGEKSNCALT